MDKTIIKAIKKDGNPIGPNMQKVIDADKRIDEIKKNVKKAIDAAPPKKNK